LVHKICCSWRAAVTERRANSDRLLYEFNEYQNPDIARLEHILTEMRDRLKAAARNRGFE
jgi:hypothetical protein